MLHRKQAREIKKEIEFYGGRIEVFLWFESFEFFTIFYVATKWNYLWTSSLPLSIVFHRWIIAHLVPLRKYFGCFHVSKYSKNCLKRKEVNKREKISKSRTHVDSCYGSQMIHSISLSQLLHGGKYIVYGAL